MKFCKDCFHHAHIKPEDVHLCMAREKALDPVTGLPMMRFCTAERIGAPSQCGPDAKLFEAAKPF